MLTVHIITMQVPNLDPNDANLLGGPSNGSLLLRQSVATASILVPLVLTVLLVAQHSGLIGWASRLCQRHKPAAVKLAHRLMAGGCRCSPCHCSCQRRCITFLRASGCLCQCCKPLPLPEPIQANGRLTNAADVQVARTALPGESKAVPLLSFVTQLPSTVDNLNSESELPAAAATSARTGTPSHRRHWPWRDQSDLDGIRDSEARVGDSESSPLLPRTRRLRR